MTPHPRLSNAGIELVKRFEGLRRRAARLEGGGWTIGYGHTVSAREGAEVTPDEAEILLIYDLDRVARAIDPLIFTPLNANQFNALVAFAFNVGTDNFRTCAVLKRINEGAYLQAGAAIELWRRATFQGDTLVVDGLVRRRAAEKALFLTPTDGFRPAPTPVLRPIHDAGADDRRDQAAGLAGAADLVVPLDGDEAVAERAADVAARPPPPEPEPEHPEPSAPPPFLAEAAGPAPRIHEPLFEPPPRRVMPEYAAEPADPPLDFGRRGAAEPAVAAPFDLQAPYLVLVAGLVGALMFVGALLAMIYGRATPLNLVIGLVGVALMAPAALRLLLGVFDPPAKP